MAKMTDTQFQQLRHASARFLEDKDYGPIQVSDLMCTIFGDGATRQENPVALEWGAYWAKLEAYEDDIKDNPKALKPTMPITVTDVIDIDENPDAPTARKRVNLKLFLPRAASTSESASQSQKRKAIDAPDDAEDGQTKRKGRAPMPLLDRLSIIGKDQKKQTKNKDFWRCIAPDCSARREGRRSEQDVINHARVCNELKAFDEGAWQAARDRYASQSLGAATGRVEPADTSIADGSSAQDGSTAKRPVGRPAKFGTPLDDPRQSRLNLRAYHDEGKAQVAGRNEEWMKEVKHAIMMLVCQCGLVPDMLDREQWRRLMMLMNPAYENVSSKDMKAAIGREAEEVDKQTVKVLQKHRNITYTLDGTSDRRGDGFYTGHACTPDRKVYFLGAQTGSKESHNAEWITKGVLMKMDEIGRGLFGGVTSDSTNTTLAARRDITAKVPTVEDLCDSIHPMHHVIGGISQLPEFDEMSGTLKPLLRHFKKSGISKSHLRDSGAGKAADGEDLKVKMLASLGKTRFATQLISVNTVEPALPRIQELYMKGIVNFKSKKLQAVFDTKTALGGQLSPKYHKFHLDLLVYQAVTTPVARSLWALEATTANASDVFVFWAAVAHTLDSLFKQQLVITPLLAQRIRAIFNDRYKEFFTHTELYFVAFCLDPRYTKKEFLRKRDESPTEEIDTNIPFPHAFIRVKNFLKNLLLRFADCHKMHTPGPPELCNCHPLIKTLPRKELSKRLKAQLTACWLGEAPFHGDVLDGDVREWIRNLLVGSSPRSDVLVMLLERIFGLLVNSMPDERTNSTITWLNSPLRGNQHASTLVDMIKVGQWYTYHAKGATGPRRTPRPPTVPFSRIDKSAVEATKMAPDPVSDSDSESEEEDSADSKVGNEEDAEAAGDTDAEEEAEQLQENEIEVLRKLVNSRKKLRGKKGTKKTFRADTQFVLDTDIKLQSSGLKWLLSDEPEPSEESAKSNRTAPSMEIDEGDDDAGDWEW